MCLEAQRLQFLWDVSGRALQERPLNHPTDKG